MCVGFLSQAISLDKISAAGFSPFTTAILATRTYEIKQEDTVAHVGHQLITVAGGFMCISI